MTLQEKEIFSRQKNCRNLAKILSIFVISIAVFWIFLLVFNIPWYRTIELNTRYMGIVPASCFIFIGFDILLLSQSRVHPLTRLLGFILIAIVFLLASLALMGYIFHINIVTHQLYLYDVNYNIIRVFPLTALNFILLGLSLLLIDVKWFEIFIYKLILLFVSATSAYTLICYFFNENVIILSTSYIYESYITGWLFLLSCIAVLLCRPERGMIKNLIEKTYSAYLFRMMFPFIIVLPIAFGWYELYGEKYHIFNDQEGEAVIAMGLVIILTSLVSFMVQVLNIEEKKRQKYANILHILEDKKILDNVFKDILKIICTTLGFSIGEIWITDLKQNKLRYVNHWHKQNEKFDRFDQVSRQIDWKFGEGLLGQVWQKGKSIWATDFTENKSYPRADVASDVGFVTAIAVPIASQNKFLGVFDFFITEKIKCDQDSLNFIEEIGILLGKYIQTHYDEDHLQYMLNYDLLTGFMNRKSFEDRMEKMIASQVKLFTLVLLNIDRFKEINHALGRDAGDKLIKMVGNILKGAIHVEKDALATIMIDEFALLLMSPTNKKQIENEVKRIHDLFKTAFILYGHEVIVRVSMSVSIYPYDGRDVQSLMKNASMILSNIKKEGGDHFQFSTPQLEKVFYDKFILQIELKKAIENNELCLHYQPQVDLKSGKIHSVEALIRWNHPVKGLLSPGDFIPIAEKAHLIKPLGQWVMRRVCEEIKRGFSIPIAMNVSVLEITEGNTFLEDIKQLIHDTDVNTDLIELEITESVLIKDENKAISLFYYLRTLGFQISLDDFGTGYSSFSYITRIPADKIKIDKSFIDGIPDDHDKSTIVQSMILLFHSLGKELIAEGVETKKQLDFLIKQGCDFVQGFYFSKPIPIEEIRLLIEKQKKFDVIDG